VRGGEPERRRQRVLCDTTSPNRQHRHVLLAQIEEAAHHVRAPPQHARARRHHEAVTGHRIAGQALTVMVLERVRDQLELALGDGHAQRPAVAGAPAGTGDTVPQGSRGHLVIDSSDVELNLSNVVE
jgi:hypothetical protein